jgi:hypothetical protein
MVRGRAWDGTVGRRQCQEGVGDGTEHGAALGVCRSGQGRYPIGTSLEASQSAVQRCYSTGGRMWGSRTLAQRSRSMSQAGL